MVKIASKSHYLNEALKQKADSDKKFSNIQPSTDVAPVRMLGMFEKDGDTYFYGKMEHPNTDQLKNGGAIMIYKDETAKLGLSGGNGLSDFIKDIEQYDFKQSAQIEAFFNDERIKKIGDSFSPFVNAQINNAMVDFVQSFKQNEADKEQPKNKQTPTSDVYSFIQNGGEVTKENEHKFGQISDYLNEYLAKSNNPMSAENSANLFRKTLIETIKLSTSIKSALDKGEHPLFVMQPSLNQVVMADNEPKSDNDPLIKLGGSAIVGNLVAGTRVLGRELVSGMFMPQTTLQAQGGNIGIKQDLHKVQGVYTHQNPKNIYNRFTHVLSDMSSRFKSKKTRNQLSDTIILSLSHGKKDPDLGSFADIPVPDIVLDFSDKNKTIADVLKQNMKPLDNPDYLNLVFERAKLEQEIIDSLDERAQDGKLNPLKAFDEEIEYSKYHELKITHPQLIENLEKDLQEINPAYVDYVRNGGSNVMGKLTNDEKTRYAIYLEKQQAMMNDEMDNEMDDGYEYDNEPSQPLFAKYMQTAFIGKQILQHEMTAEFLRHAYEHEKQTFHAMGIDKKDVFNKSELKEFNSRASEKGVLTALRERHLNDDGTYKNTALQEFHENVALSAYENPKILSNIRAGMGGKNSAFNLLQGNQKLNDFENEQNRRELYRNGATVYHAIVHGAHSVAPNLSLIQAKKYTMNTDPNSQMILNKGINKQLVSLFNADFIKKNTIFNPNSLELKSDISYDMGASRNYSENAKLATNALAMGSSLMRNLHIATSDDFTVNNNGVLSFTAYDHITYLKTASNLINGNYSHKQTYESNERKQLVSTWADKIKTDVSRLVDMADDIKQGKIGARMNPSSLPFLASSNANLSAKEIEAQNNKRAERGSGVYRPLFNIHDAQKALFVPQDENKNKLAPKDVLTADSKPVSHEIVKESTGQSYGFETYEPNTDKPLQAKTTHAQAQDKNLEQVAVNEKSVVSIKTEQNDNTVNFDDNNADYDGASLISGIVDAPGQTQVQQQKPRAPTM